ncbi:MAG TPA: SPOR domain-containing protein [Patescibacteria group bacterium]|nr:SPOR domain-containing protein [Patescibacteria group bacterium]
MASGRRGQSEINLGAGHVAGIFLAVVVLCGIFFTLGYVMGRGGSPGKASGTGGSSPAMTAGGSQATGNRAPGSTGWDFFPNKSSSSHGPAGTPSPGLTPGPQPVASAAGRSSPSGPISMTPRPAGVRIDRKPPSLRGGRQGVLLQVAAMANRGDALALVGFLKQKGYPAFAWGPSSDRLYRVQVGPYANTKAARAARIHLEKEGFRSILKKQ